MIKLKKKFVFNFAVLLLVSALLSVAMVLTGQSREKVYADCDFDVSIYQGAEIRVALPVGIRFTGYVNDDYFSDTETKTLKDGVTVGMLIVPSDLLGENPLEKSESMGHIRDYSTATLSNFKWSESDIEGAQMFSIAIVGSNTSEDFPAAEVARTLMARVYVSDAVTTKYSDTVSRSCALVANKALTKNALYNYVNGKNMIAADILPKLETYRSGSSINVNGHISIDNGSFVWQAVANAEGYYIRYGDTIIDVKDDGSSEYSVSMSAFGIVADDPAEVDIAPYGDGVNYTTASLSYSRTNLYVTDINGGIANGVTRGYLSNFNSGVNGLLEVTKTDETLNETPIQGTKIQVRSSARRSVFALSLTDGLNLTEHSGIKVTFKVTRCDHTLADGADALDYGLQFVGDIITENYTGSNYKTEVGALNTWAVMYIPNSVLSSYYSEGARQIVLEQSLINAASSDNIKLNEFVIGEVCYYDVTTLDTPTDLAVSDAGIITWDAVSNADGYVVDINGTTYNVDTNSYTIANPSSVSYATVKVKAVSDSALYGDSVWTDDVNAYLFAENELANFNSAQYTNNVEYINGSRASANAWKVAPSYDNGTVKFSVFLNNYDTSSSAASKLAAFKVKLPKGLDLTQDGITIRLQIYDKSGVLTLSSFSLLDKGGNATWCTSGETAYPNVSVTYQEWAEMIVTSAQLTATGYAAGDTELYFGVWVTENQALYGGYNVSLQLDYIEYADIEILDAPTNLAVSDAGVITWDTVSNADGYVVDINGTTYNVDTNSYTIANPSSVSYITIKVKAISDNALLYDSVWTDAVSAYVFAENELANFNNAQYTNNVEYITGNRWSKWRTAPSYDNGTVKFGLYLDNYNTASNAGSPLAAVKVVLPKGLDLTQDGITIRFQVYDKSGALTPSSFSILEKGGNATWGTSGVTAYPNVSVTYQEWAELTITSAQLTAMGYSAGDTELYLGVWLTQPMQITVSYGLWLQLDYIEYADNL